MYKAIYEKLTPDQSAVYQIKFKGEISPRIQQLKERYLLSRETTDLCNPVSMLTGEFLGQGELMEVLNILHSEKCPIIYLTCLEITANDDS